MSCWNQISQRHGTGITRQTAQFATDKLHLFAKAIVFLFLFAAVALTINRRRVNSNESYETRVRLNEFAALSGNGYRFDQNSLRCVCAHPNKDFWHQYLELCL